MLSYSYFADFYDNLTNNVDYKGCAEYILKLAENIIIIWVLLSI